MLGSRFVAKSRKLDTNKSVSQTRVGRALGQIECEPNARGCKTRSVIDTFSRVLGRAIGLLCQLTYICH